MLGFAFMKASPTRFVLRYANGVLKQRGPGLSFYYLPQFSTIVQVPIESRDLPFVFNELSADYQPLIIQGQMTYQITDPVEVATRLDFTVNARGVWTGEGPAVLNQRLLNLLQVTTRARVGGQDMRTALGSSDTLGTAVKAGLQSSESVARLGVEILDVSILQVRTSPEMTRALEAEAREGLQREADQAVYDRRNAAVEQERRIKENEFTTELGVEQGKRTIQETGMAARIAVEDQRTVLLDGRMANDRKLADTRAYALEASLRPLKDMDWRVLTAATGGNGDPRQNIALAFRELADNAAKIGQLTITPDVLGLLSRQ